MFVYFFSDKFKMMKCRLHCSAYNALTMTTCICFLRSLSDAQESYCEIYSYLFISFERCFLRHIFFFNLAIAHRRHWTHWRSHFFAGFVFAYTQIDVVFTLFRSTEKHTQPVKRNPTKKTKEKCRNIFFTVYYTINAPRRVLYSWNGICFECRSKEIIIRKKKSLACIRYMMIILLWKR